MESMGMRASRSRNQAKGSTWFNSQELTKLRKMAIVFHYDHCREGPVVSTDGDAVQRTFGLVIVDHRLSNCAVRSTSICRRTLGSFGRLLGSIATKLIVSA